MEVESVKALSMMRSYVTNIILRRKLNARTFFRPDKVHL